jgi:hypothetical protein
MWQKKGERERLSEGMSERKTERDVWADMGIN